LFDLIASESLHDDDNSDDDDDDEKACDDDDDDEKQVMIRDWSVRSTTLTIGRSYHHLLAGNPALEAGSPHSGSPHGSSLGHDGFPRPLGQAT